jgi:hypothetical protein
MRNGFLGQLNNGINVKQLKKTVNYWQNFLKMKIYHKIHFTFLQRKLI